MFARSPSVLAILVAGGVSWTASGCGSDELAPLIEQLRYIDQVPQKPLMLRFDVAFADSDGDLGLGTMHLTLDGAERSELPMDQVFGSQTPPVARDALEGSFEVVVELEGPVGGGRQVEVGVWLVDRRGGESNRPTVTLQATETTES